VTDTGKTIVVEKNRQRALWALVILGFVFLVSAALLVTGLLNKQGILWPVVGLGAVGAIGFGISGLRVIGTMRSPWNLTLDPIHLTLRTQTYTINVPWENIASIGVADVNRRQGCVLVFEDVEKAVNGTQFHARSNRADIITDADAMLDRMEDNIEHLGYHLGIPGRMLEKGAEELAELLTNGRIGKLWLDNNDD
jgi:hypothetical protein